jgi:hypothetical protein
MQAVHLKENEVDSSPSDVAQVKDVQHRMNVRSVVCPDSQVLSGMTHSGHSAAQLI